MSERWVDDFEAVEQLFEEGTNLVGTGTTFERWRAARPGLARQAINLVRRRTAAARRLADIDIELGETTPLLEAGSGSGSAGAGAISAGTSGAAAASVGAGTASGTVSGTVIGVGAGAAVVGTALGISLSNGATLPGHHYIGPGNDEDADEEPVDEDDRIAQEHDIRYANAKTQEDIIAADEDAINQFDKDWQETSNIHSALGKVGIGIKKAVEGRTGVLYPSNLPRKYG